MEFQITYPVVPVKNELVQALYFEGRFVLHTSVAQGLFFQAGHINFDRAREERVGERGYCITNGPALNNEMN